MLSQVKMLSCSKSVAQNPCFYYITGQIVSTVSALNHILSPKCFLCTHALSNLTFSVLILAAL